METFLHLYTALYFHHHCTTGICNSQSFPPNFTDLILRHQPPSPILSYHPSTSPIDSDIWYRLSQVQISSLSRIAYDETSPSTHAFHTSIIPPSTIRSSSNRAFRPFQWNRGSRASDGKTQITTM